MHIIVNIYKIIIIIICIVQPSSNNKYNSKYNIWHIYIYLNILSEKIQLYIYLSITHVCLIQTTMELLFLLESGNLLKIKCTLLDKMESFVLHDVEFIKFHLAIRWLDLIPLKTVKPRPLYFREVEPCERSIWFLD